MIVYSSKSEKITLADTPITKGGGEGEVRKIISAPAAYANCCVKLYYRQKRTKELENKIKFMVNNPPAQVQHRGFVLAWAKETVYENNSFVGFIMPLAFSGSEKLTVLTSKTLYHKLGSEWNKYARTNGGSAVVARLKLMSNIAVPIHLLHETGKYVMKDFKPENVLVTHSGQVTICDMDSIQITNGQSMLFHGTAATPHYIPPEAFNNDVGKNEKTDILQKSWDYFAVSIVFYELLFGLHPYMCAPKVDSNSDDGLVANISNDLFPFGCNRANIAKVPTDHEKFEKLPANIQNLFIRSFSTKPAQRPSVEEWGKNIHEIIANAKTPAPPVVPPKPPTAPQKPKPEPPRPTPQPPKPPTGTGGNSGSSGKGWVWFFVIVGIILLIWIIAANSCNDNDYSTQTYQSGDNAVVVAETPAEEYTAVDTTAVAVAEEYYETPAESGRVIYSGYYGDNYATCNGIYPYDDAANAQYFSVNLGNELNRNHFKISFYFWVTAHKNQWALMLSEGYRVFGVNVDNGQIYISTNNADKYYNTGKNYQLDTWNYVSVEYYYGRVSVNGGDWFNVEMNTEGGDNVLSSINYSSGNAFNGYLSSIEVTSY
jgi:serine/threonine protein kinase